MVWLRIDYNGGPGFDAQVQSAYNFVRGGDIDEVRIYNPPSAILVLTSVRTSAAGRPARAENRMVPRLVS
jgi:hypothetical protein